MLLVSGEVGAHQLAIEGTRGRDFRNVDILVSRVRPAAGTRPALEGIPLTEEDPVGAGGTAELPGSGPESARHLEKPGAGRGLAGNQATGGHDHVAGECSPHFLGKL